MESVAKTRFAVSIKIVGELEVMGALRVEWSTVGYAVEVEVEVKLQRASFRFASELSCSFVAEIRLNGWLYRTLQFADG